MTTSAYGVVVRKPVEGDARRRHELWNDTERGDSLEVLVVLEHPWQLLFSGADAQIVEDDVPLRVSEFLCVHLLLLGVDHDFRILGVDV